MAPSVSYSITARLEVASRGRAVLADVVSPDEIGPHYIIPSVFHPDVASSVAVAVRDAATQQPER
jgi:malate dehydrogenase (oxaloacetate-decarboxylating)